MDYIDIFIKNNYINLKQIAESGQCFRWKKMCPGRYFVISDGRAACFFQEKTGISADTLLWVFLFSFF